MKDEDIQKKKRTMQQIVRTLEPKEVQKRLTAFNDYVAGLCIMRKVHKIHVTSQLGQQSPSNLHLLVS